MVPVAVVNREGEHRRVTGERRPGAVAVVQVEVDYEYRLLEAICAQRDDRRRDVVVDAESAAGLGSRVVQTAREVGRDPVVAAHVTGGQDGAADLGPLRRQYPLAQVVVEREAEDRGETLGMMKGFQVLLGVDRE